MCRFQTSISTHAVQPGNSPSENYSFNKTTRSNMDCPVQVKVPKMPGYFLWCAITYNE